MNNKPLELEENDLNATPLDAYIDSLSSMLTKWEEVAGKVFTEGHGKERALGILYIEMVKQIQAQIAHDIPIMENHGQKLPDCKAGCHWCCHGKVTCTSIEIVALAMHIKKSGLDFSGVLNSLAAFNSETEKKWNGNIVERDKKEVFLCPLLEKSDAGLVCGVNEFKPMPCRSYLAPDARKCKVGYRKTKRGEDYQVPYFPQFMHISSAMMTGVVAALKNVGLEWRPLEMTKALSIALSYEPDDLLAAFWTGEPIFAPAYDEIIPLPEIENMSDVEKLESFVASMSAYTNDLKAGK